MLGSGRKSKPEGLSPQPRAKTPPALASPAGGPLALQGEAEPAWAAGDGKLKPRTRRQVRPVSEAGHSLPSSPARRLPLSAAPFTAAKAAGRRPPAPCLCDPAGPLACTSRRAAAPAPGTRSAPDPVILSGLSRAAGPPHRPLGVDQASPLRVVEIGRAHVCTPV